MQKYFGQIAREVCFFLCVCLSDKSLSHSCHGEIIMLPSLYITIAMIGPLHPLSMFHGIVGAERKGGTFACMCASAGSCC